MAIALPHRERLWHPWRAQGSRLDWRGEDSVSAYGNGCFATPPPGMTPSPYPKLSDPPYPPPASSVGCNSCLAVPADEASPSEAPPFGQAGRAGIAFPPCQVLREPQGERAAHPRQLTSYMRTGSSKPRRAVSPRSENRKRLPAAIWRTASETSISPPLACAAMRAARMTAVPNRSDSSSMGSPASGACEGPRPSTGRDRGRANRRRWGLAWRQPGSLAWRPPARRGDRSRCCWRRRTPLSSDTPG